MENKVEIITINSQIKSRLRDLNKKKGKVAFDYETTGLKPEAEGHRIVSVSFCLDGNDTFAIPVDNSIYRHLSKILRNPNLQKIASNMKFEEKWTRHFLKHGVTNWFWDTMLEAHIMDNRPKITSVKFLSYILFGLGDYDSHLSSYLKAENSNGLNSIHMIPIKELLLYNGMDSLLEYMVMEEQRKVVGY